MARYMIVSLSDFIAETMRAIYYLAPHNTPRKADIIKTKAIERFKHADGIEQMGDFYFKHVPFDGLTDFIKGILWDIPEFRELNLTDQEFSAGVDPDDESRDKFFFTCAYDFNGPSFIDLDACIQNISYGLFHRELMDYLYESDFDNLISIGKEWGWRKH